MVNKSRFPLQRQPGNPCGIAPSRQGHTGRQALEVGQHTERCAGVDAQSGSTEHRDIPGHLQQHLLREHSLCPPRPWARQHRRHSKGGKQRKTISSRCSLGAGSIVCREPVTPWRGNYGMSSHMGRVKMLQEARNGFLAACQDLSPSKA